MPRSLSLCPLDQVLIYPKHLRSLENIHSKYWANDGIPMPEALRTGNSRHPQPRREGGASTLFFQVCHLSVSSYSVFLTGFQEKSPVQMLKTFQNFLSILPSNRCSDFSPHFLLGGTISQCVYLFLPPTGHTLGHWSRSVSQFCPLGRIRPPSS